MKKEAAWGIALSFFAGIFSFSFVSALDLKRVGESTVNFYADFFEPILRALFGGQDYTGALLFEKLLLFLIFVSLVYLALTRIPLFSDKKAVIWVITIAVGLLGVRFIAIDWLMAVIAQYKVLAIVLTALLPFLIYFFFLYNVAGDYPIIRKIGWALFMGIYLGLWSTAPDPKIEDIYMWTFIVSLVCLIFDNKIERSFMLRQIVKQDASFKEREIGRIRAEINAIHNEVTSGALDAKTGAKLIKQLEGFKMEIIKTM